MDRVAVHEWGHLLGLAHSDVNGTVMSGPAYSDLQQPEHAAPTTTCAAAAASTGPPPGSRPATCARCPASSRSAAVPTGDDVGREALTLTNDGNASLTLQAATSSTRRLRRDRLRRRHGARAGPGLRAVADVRADHAEAAYAAIAVDRGRRRSAALPRLAAGTGSTRRRTPRRRSRRRPRRSRARPSARRARRRSLIARPTSAAARCRDRLHARAARIRATSTARAPARSEPRSAPARRARSRSRSRRRRPAHAARRSPWARTRAASRCRAVRHRRAPARRPRSTRTRGPVFADQQAGTQSAPQNVTVSNAGGGTLTLTSIAIGGTSATDFTRGGTCTAGTVLAAAQSCTASIRLAPVTAGPSRRRSPSAATRAARRSGCRATAARPSTASNVSSTTTPCSTTTSSPSAPTRSPRSTPARSRAGRAPACASRRMRARKPASRRSAASTCRPATATRISIRRARRSALVVHQQNPAFVLESTAVMYFAIPDSVTGACPGGTDPVYRVWNRRPDTNHRYTSYAHGARRDGRAGLRRRGQRPRHRHVLRAALTVRRRLVGAYRRHPTSSGSLTRATSSDARDGGRPTCPCGRLSFKAVRRRGIFACDPATGAAGAPSQVGTRHAPAPSAITADDLPR